MRQVLKIKRALLCAGRKRGRRRNIWPWPVLMLAIGMLSTSIPISVDAQTVPPVSGAEANSAPGPFTVFIDEASQRFNIPSPWLRAVIQAESVGDAQAVSPKGAMGLMQIMPETYAQLRRDYGLGDNPFDPHDNIMAGAAYLREMYDLYGAPGFLAAYNAGPERYDDHLVTGQPLPLETQLYLSRVEPLIDGVQVDRIMEPDPLAWINAPLFIEGNANAEINVNPHGAKVAFFVSGQAAVPLFTGATNANVTALAPRSDSLFAPTTPGEMPR